MIKIVLSLEEKISSLDVVKVLVNKMNDFEFRPDTDNSQLAYQDYKNQLREAFNYLKYESNEDWEEANHYIQENLKILSIW